ncbi:dihydrofolate reductase [Botrimarina sp.]|uniref:dihydrofolate reductase n=1 Tax=Botrimarina sp. TaxID=2795802 RepID=UPI0032EB5C81
MVVAAAENGVIGRDGELPWRLPADLRRFKSLTMGHAIVMGRKTFESIGRPLPGRVSVVLTRDTRWSVGEEVRVAHDLPEAIRLASTAEGMQRDAVYVIGGEQVYRLAAPAADRVHLTRVHATVEGDARFPPLDPAEWRRVEAEAHPADEENEHAFTFEVWERVGQ